MQTNLAGFAGCQECLKARRSRMVLDNLRKLLNHHAAKKRKLGSLKKCKQRDLFQQSSYDKLDVSGFIHHRINHSKEFADRQNHINGIENFWNQAKRVLRKYNGIDS